MGESRQELLTWLNHLLQLNITKVEQCGTGAALCQVFDSIYLDIPMARVKFNVNTEYAYIQNFKILQSCFTRHQIDRLVPVEALVKCKMQDNLEFLQWSKRYWDQYYPGGEYDAISRRRAAGPGASSMPPPGSAPPRATSGARTRPGIGGSSSGSGPSSNTGAPRARLGGGGGTTSASAAALQQENSMLKEHATGLEKERDFYFAKLRDIELLIQQAINEQPDLEKDEGGMVKQIQSILYSTEEGFEIPEQAEGEAPVEEETF